MLYRMLSSMPGLYIRCPSTTHLWCDKQKYLQIFARYQGGKRGWEDPNHWLRSIIAPSTFLQFSHWDLPFHLAACSPLLPIDLVFGLLWNHESFSFSPSIFLGLSSLFLVFSSATHIPKSLSCCF